jgi:hypothetical protein
VNITTITEIAYKLVLGVENSFFFVRLKGELLNKRELSSIFSFLFFFKRERRRRRLFILRIEYTELQSSGMQDPVILQQ